MKDLCKLFDYVCEDDFSSLYSCISTKQLVLQTDYFGVILKDTLDSLGFNWTVFPLFSNRLEVLLS